MKKVVLLFIKSALSLVGIAIILFLVTVGPAFFSVMRHEMNGKKLLKKEIYEEVAKELALYCQSVDRHHPYDVGSRIWVPDVILRTKLYSGGIGPDSASFYMGGGFVDSYGYQLLKNPDLCTKTQNVWELFYTINGSEERLLFTVKLNKTNHIPPEKLFNINIQRHNQAIQDEPNDVKKYQKKFGFLLQYRELEDARKVAEDCIKKLPKHWWPQLAKAHIDCRLGKTKTAAETFTKWVDANPSYPHYIYLFLFNMREGFEDESIEAIRKTLGQKFIETKTIDCSKYLLAYNSLAYAFQQKEYSLMSQVEQFIEKNGKPGGLWELNFARLYRLVMIDEKKQAMDLFRKLEKQPVESWRTDNPGSKTLPEIKEAIELENKEFFRNLNNSFGNPFTWRNPAIYDEILPSSKKTNSAKSFLSGVGQNSKQSIHEFMADMTRLEEVIRDGPDLPLNYEDEAQNAPHVKKTSMTLIGILERTQGFNTKGAKGRTPLYWAAEYGKPGIAKYLISQGASLENQNRSDYSPIHVAAMEGHTALVALFLDAGVDIHIRGQVGLTPLHLAAGCGHKKLVEYLIAKGADVNNQTSFGSTPLYECIIPEQIEIARVLHKHGAKLTHLTNSPLHRASQSNCIKMVKFLLSKGVDPNTRNESGQTALFTSHLEMLKLLVKAGADVNAKGNNGYTPLKYLRNSSEEIKEFLRKNGAHE